MLQKLEGDARGVATAGRYPPAHTIHRGTGCWRMRGPSSGPPSRSLPCAQGAVPAKGGGASAGWQLLRAERAVAELVMELYEGDSIGRHSVWEPAQAARNVDDRRSRWRQRRSAAQRCSPPPCSARSWTEMDYAKSHSRSPTLTAYDDWPKPKATMTATAAWPQPGRKSLSSTCSISLPN